MARFGSLADILKNERKSAFRQKRRLRVYDGTPGPAPAPSREVRPSDSPGVMSPPCERAMSRAIASASLVPPSSRLRASSRLRNASGHFVRQFVR
jgi:hypothetical protein